MTVKQIVSKISKLEGKKHQASVGDIREIVGIISDLAWKDSLVTFAFIRNGAHRYFANEKKKHADRRKK